jgi:hypothetical protein
VAAGNRDRAWRFRHCHRVNSDSESQRARPTGHPDVNASNFAHAIGRDNHRVRTESSGNAESTGEAEGRDYTHARAQNVEGTTEEHN